MKTADFAHIRVLNNNIKRNIVIQNALDNGYFWTNRLFYLVTFKAQTQRVDVVARSKRAFLHQGEVDRHVFVAIITFRIYVL